MKRCFYSMMIVLVAICFVLSCDVQVDKDSFGGREVSIEEYEKHTYVVVDGFKKYGIAHNPDCECKKEKK